MFQKIRMLKAKYFLIFATIFVLQACMVYSICSQIKEDRMTISDSYVASGNTVYSKCWKVWNPSEDQLYFRIDELHLGTANNNRCNLSILAKDGSNKTFWSGSKTGYFISKSLEVEIRFSVESGALPNNYNANFTLVFQKSLKDLSCSQIKEEKGNISDSYIVYSSFVYSKCWEILNPSRHQLYLHLKGLNLQNANYTYCNLTVVADEGNSYTYWSGLNSGNLNTKSPRVEIRFNIISSYISNNYIASFDLQFQKSMIHSSCYQVKEEKGIISDSYLAYGHNIYSKCWEVLNPTKHQLYFHLEKLNLKQVNYTRCNLTVTLKDEGTVRTYYSGMNSGTMDTLSSKVEIRFNIESGPFPNNYIANFTLGFQKKILADVDVKDIRSMAIYLLKNQTSDLDLRYDPFKALTALYLVGDLSFDGTDDKEELLVKRAELKIALSMQRNPASNMDLSTYINFLLVTCNSPRLFGFPDLIEQLVQRLEKSSNYTHPLVYLALCNANEPWPRRAVHDLQNILRNQAQYLFVQDIQVLAIMAISCKLNQNNSLNVPEVKSLIPLYNTSIRHLMGKQLSDGSFGTLRETAVAVQTLISDGKELSFEWNSRTAIKFIAEKLNSTSVDFQDLYLSLPVLNKKSLVDISKRNCSGNPRNKVSDYLFNENRGFKVEVPSNQVRYSLYIGDDRQLIRTTSIPFPDNFTAYQVMLMAEAKQSNFNFQWRKVSGKIFVHTIAGISNDPVNGKFWMIYIDSNDNKPQTLHVSKGPDEIFLKKGDHLIMWFKTVNM